MALKRKISKADFDKLSDALKAEYKPNSMNTDEYFLDVDDASEITRARDREKARADKLESEKTALTEKLETVEADLVTAKKASKNTDVAELETAWTKKLNDQKTKYEGQLAKKDSYLTTQLVDNEAQRIAAKISTAPAVILPHIKARLRAELDGETPITRVLGADGKVSAMTVDELANELVANKDFSAIMIASRASGSSGPGQKPTLPQRGSAGSGGQQQQNGAPDLTALKPKDLAASLQDKVAARKAAATG
jgi:hypothetical protein